MELQRTSTFYVISMFYLFTKSTYYFCSKKKQGLEKIIWGKKASAAKRSN